MSGLGPAAVFSAVIRAGVMVCMSTHREAMSLDVSALTGERTSSRIEIAPGWLHVWRQNVRRYLRVYKIEHTQGE